MYEIKHLVFILIVLMIPTISSCATHNKLWEKENKLGTDGEDLSVFHRLAERDRGLGLRFPGYLIGIEKAYREKIGYSEKNNIDGLDIRKFKIGQSEDQEINKDREKNYTLLRKILDDPKRTFISHIVEYQLQQSSMDLPYIKENIFHNVYTKEVKSQQAYEAAICSLKLLKDKINKNVNETNDPYTHIFFYSMGWNTDQQEALRNYNSLLGLLMEHRNSDESFKPLFVGLTWPSEWSWSFFESFGKLVSYPVKSNDADEVGVVWGNRILRDILIPLKKEKKIPLILIGHSFGARVITRSLFGYPLMPADATGKPNKNDVDLVLCLQGAFSINRFIKHSGKEGSPYQDFSQYAKKIVLTWSEHDGANPVAAFITGAKHVGGRYGYDRSIDKDDNAKKIFEQFTVQVQGTSNFYDFNYNGIKEIKNWKASFSDSTKISMVNASNLIKNAPYAKGGRAHSDIYSPGIAMFIWDILNTMEK